MYSFKFEKEEQEGWRQMNVSPIFGNDAKLSVSRQPGEKYCRYDFKGSFTFVNADFLMFSDAGVVDSYRMVLYYSAGGTSQPVEVIKCYFNLTDMELDWDNRIARLDLKGKDQYEDFLAKYDAEYDLVQLAPPRKNVNLYKRAFLQIYIQGDTKITNVLGNTEYQADVSDSSKSAAYLNGLCFSHIKSQSTVRIVTSKQYSYLQKYDGIYNQDGMGHYTREDGQYEIRQESPLSETYIVSPRGIVDPLVEKMSFQQRVYSDIEGADVRYTSELSVKDKSGASLFAGGEAQVTDLRIFARLISDKKIGDIAQNVISEGDIWQKNLNYHYRYYLPGEWVDDIRSRIKITRTLTDTPNKWQRDDDGKYFVPPTPSIPSRKVVAIGWSQWIPNSIWFENGVDLDERLSQYNEGWTLKDAYPIQDSIKVLLNKVAPDVTLVSDFLDNSGLGGYSNPILGNGRTVWLFLTPVTNIKRTYYDTAAQKGKISLRQILDMLRKCFKCYWYLENLGGKWVLRIEHEDWYGRGGSYEHNLVYRDLRAEKVDLSGKKWLNQQDKTTFDTGELRSRVTYAWGDKASEIFNGYPYVSESYDTACKTADSETAENFVADIDLIESAPDSLSNDTFVVIGTDDKDGGTVLMSKVGYQNPDGSLSAQHPQYLPQNSALTFYFLEQNFLNYDVPMLLGTRMEMEGGNLRLRIRSSKYTVVQNFGCPYAIDKPDLCPELFFTDNAPAVGGNSVFRKITTRLADEFSEFEVSNDYNI